MADGSTRGLKLEVPVLPLRDAVSFPHATGPYSVGRPRSIRLVEALPSDESERVAVLVLQRSQADEDPAIADLHPVGTLARILHVSQVRRGGPGYAVLAAGVQRVRLVAELAREPYLRARVELLEDVVPTTDDPEYLALKDSLQKLFTSFVERSSSVSADLLGVLQGIDDPSLLSDIVAATAPLGVASRQQLLETLDVRERMRRLVEELVIENEKLDLQQKIQSEVRDRVAGEQREHFLREQLRAIHRELGEDDEGTRLEDLRKAVEDAGMPEEVRKEALRELARLRRIPDVSAEYTVVRNYLDWLVSVPWNRRAGGEVDIARAARVLDEDHYDLEKVKQRILEYLAVLRRRREIRGAILCFVGPPGVGKTSLGRSIARALGRQFARLSLGGMHDEAELRGHRRTYVGAMPGQIIQALRRVGTRDPVFMLDEVDKIGRDFRGDPAAALLEILDPEQNNTFRDHYLDLPFDLSKVLFICTANVLDPIAPPLLDRMEVLSLSGYSEEEKLHIARRYLLPKQLAENGLGEDDIRFTDEALREIARHYTREAGVRGLEREIGALCRKRARRLEEGAPGESTITEEVVRSELGPPRHLIETELEQRTRRPGVAVGLAWTPVGGDVLFVEASAVSGGRGGLTLTGQLGDVMQESAKAALTWVRTRARGLGLDPQALKDCDFHVHVPAGAVPKDGPSAGVVMVAALVSALLGRPVRHDVAMTGEIMLSGDVLPVGGIREKVLAARRSGVREVVLPGMNEANVREDVPATVRDEMVFHYVSDIEHALEHAFGGRPATAGPVPAPPESRRPAAATASPR
jgi:ATP-dependent Lon protease